MSIPTINQLVNAQLEAIGQSDLASKIAKANSYYTSEAYPTYGNERFGGWPLDEKRQQVYPKIFVPLPSIVVNKSATFLMKNPPRFYVRGKQAVTDEIRRVLDRNQVDLKACAKRVGIEGGLWFKFYKDQADTMRPWKINTLSVNDIIPVYNPHDLTDLQMVRVQYRYQGQDGKDYWFREEWTNAEYVQYEELPGAILNPRMALEAARSGDLIQEKGSPWRIKSRVANPYRVIPFQLVRNRIDTLTPNGEGDFWGLFDLFDRINIAYDNMDISNQYGGGPVAVFFEADNTPDSLAPHSVYTVTGPNAKVELLEHSGHLRRNMEWFAEKLESFAYSQSGIVNPKLEDVAGLGQLSYAALQLLHGPLLESTEEKRRNWAQYGLCPFFEKLLFAESQLGDGPGWSEDMDIQAAWPDYFPLGGVDKQVEIANVTSATNAGYPFEYAARDLARIMGVPEDELPEFLSKVEEDMEERQKVMEAIEAVKQIGGGPGGNKKPGLQNQAADGSVKGAARKQSGGSQ